MREIKFRTWFFGTMKNIDVLAISPCTWGCPDRGKFGVSIAYQPSAKIMQYSGLKDSEGVEIYEDDVVEETVHFRRKFIVKYSDHYLRWQLSQLGEGYDAEIFSWIHPEMTLKVVGNIYENPELLG